MVSFAGRCFSFFPATFLFGHEYMNYNNTLPQICICLVRRKTENKNHLSFLIQKKKEKIQNHTNKF